MLKYHSVDEVFEEPISLNDFEILNKIGEGAFSKVYKAKWLTNKSESFSNKVALKIMTKNNCIRSNLADKIYNEAKLLFGLSQPSIIKCFASFQNSKEFVIVLEYLSTDLFSIMQKNLYFGESTVRFLSSQILLGLEYLHFFNIAYRDLKPENTLIASNGNVKLADFTFSKQITGRTYTCQGTLEYMAPEILLNQGHGLAVDWWAFGVLLYELCAGHSPFRMKFQLTLIKKIVAGKFQFPSHFSDELRDLINQILIVDVTKRLGSTHSKEDGIKSHSWFSEEIEWSKVNKEYTLPKELRDLDIDEGSLSDESDFSDF